MGSRITPLGKVVLFLMVVGFGVGAYRYWQRLQPVSPGAGTTARTNDGDTGSSSTTPSRPPTADTRQSSLLGRPLRVGLLAYPAYAPGIVANNGMEPNEDSAYFRDHNLLVQFLDQEDYEARINAFKRGGEGGTDIVISTIDSFANELAGYRRNGIDAKAFLQVDWGRGSDAIVADRSIRSIEDLYGKKIALNMFTPSHWLLQSAVNNSRLSTTQQDAVMMSIIGKNSGTEARDSFIAKQVDAAVLWEPDISDAIAKREGSHRLLSTETAANLIGDILVAKADFIRDNPKVIQAFVDGWFSGVEECNRNPSLCVEKIMEAFPLFKEVGEDGTRGALSLIKLTDATDNAKTFGITGSSSFFNQIFREANTAWVKRRYIREMIDPNTAKDAKFVSKAYAALPKPVREVARQPEFTYPAQVPPEVKKARPVLTRSLDVFFGSNSAEITQSAKQTLAKVGPMLSQYSNAYVRIEGHSARTGNAKGEKIVSERRVKSISRYLANAYNLDPNRFVAVGKGSSESTGWDQAVDRRTDIEILPR